MVGRTGVGDGTGGRAAGRRPHGSTGRHDGVGAVGGATTPTTARMRPGPSCPGASRRVCGRPRSVSFRLYVVYLGGVVGRYRWLGTTCGTPEGRHPETVEDTLLPSHCFYSRVENPHCSRYPDQSRNVPRPPLRSCGFQYVCVQS